MNNIKSRRGLPTSEAAFFMPLLFFQVCCCLGKRKHPHTKHPCTEITHCRKVPFLLTFTIINLIHLKGSTLSNKILSLFRTLKQGYYESTLSKNFHGWAKYGQAVFRQRKRSNDGLPKI